MYRSRVTTDAEEVSVTNSSGSWIDVMADPSWFQCQGFESQGRLPSVSGTGRQVQGSTSRTTDVRRVGAESNESPYVSNGESLPCGSATSSQENDSASGVNERLTRSLDLGHNSLQRLSSEPGDSLSTSIDYVWDADELIDTRRYKSLPHGGVYATTVNGSLPGSPFHGRRAEEPDQTDKMKNKLMAAWNNMRHGMYYY